ncbi:hypothetical protein ES705_40128 [subsurface metagenome]
MLSNMVFGGREFGLCFAMHGSDMHCFRLVVATKNGIWMSDNIFNYRPELFNIFRIYYKSTFSVAQIPVTLFVI